MVCRYMRILHFIPYYKPAWLYGGPIRSVSQLCESTAAEGHQVSVATTNSNGRNCLDVCSNVPVTVDGVTVYYFKRQPLPFYIESLPLRKHIASLVAGADIVHLHHVWVPLCVAVARAAYDAGKPYVLSLHGSINRWHWANRSIRHKLFWRMQASSMVAHASALHVTGELERRELLAVGVVPEKDIAVIPNPVNAAVYARNRLLAETFRRENGILPQQKLILYMGRLHPQKGIDLFLRSAAPCLHAAPEWLCLIAGPSEGEYISTLQAITRDEGLESQVRFLGIIDRDIRLGVLSAADLFFLTSHNENFGMGVVEAMSASVPVLVSNKVGLSHELTQSGAGCVTSLDRQSIETALYRLMSEPDLRKRYACAGLALVKDRFDCGAVARQTICVYQSVRKSSLTQQSFRCHVAPASSI
jgi:glycosyltransferase involved in cell wall biosynthesis